MVSPVSKGRFPEAIGPYSQAIKAEEFVFVSGQIALTLSGEMIKGDIKVQVKQVLDNLEAILKAAGSSMDRVVKTTIYLKDLNNFQQVNEVYGEYFSKHKPARSTVQVARLPKDAEVEIEAIAVL